ncbi:MAG: adenylosuccinate synthase [Phycisphaerae bacterium]|nr:adenylosuccinate synthase [Phycisphaerae bacterium]MCZ2401148.1 adenylosuccinate synthase [Phycisphaerae bacterium]NUQ50320.1 adenylosuccinate synthase [Phycisphaerae bacterium]
MRLGHTCVVGLQWGDEGKGKIVDSLVEHFDVVVRYAGGANAGHTVVIGDARFALHQLPSGILRPGVASIIGCGSAIDPPLLLGEIESLRARGIAIGDNLRISDRAQLVFPYHRRQDVLAEQAALPGGKLGTTARGIGPCYADKVSRRWGVRVCELYHPPRFTARLSEIVAHKNAYLTSLYDFREPFDAQALTTEYLGFAEQLRPFVCDTALYLSELLRAGRRVLFEGAQGSLLDIDHGTYPFVTSSNTGVGGVASGAGVPPRTIQDVVGVVKAYSTRVGEGPFPTELHDRIGDDIRERGREFGTTTGRPRRTGWFDAVAAGYSSMISGPTHLAVMHLDTLSGLEELRVCVAYRARGRVLNSFPADTPLLNEVEPVYETLPGWTEPIGHCRQVSQLPAAARAYLDFLSARLSAPVSIIGVGPERDQIIFAGREG